MKQPFPFSAIVGQDEMKRSILITAVDPSVGGVLILGDRGTGKSTAVRALAALLPPIRATRGCPYHCDPAKPSMSCAACREVGWSRNAPTAGQSGTGARPCEVDLIAVPVVDLPLGATEDRVVGALDLEKALSHGQKSFEPGLLARANRGFLYIDEVNLLEDHLVDLLIDVAASGENVVEREGLSVRHPARFVLVGSGNPEEGELRPQLLDRFGLSVDVRTPADIPTRVEVIKRRDAYERQPEAFCAQWKPEDAQIRQQIEAARKRVGDLPVPDDVLEKAATLCMHLGTDGLRGELTLLRAARAWAAFRACDRVSLDDLRDVAPCALRHRLRRNPLDDTGAGVRIDRALTEILGAQAMALGAAAAVTAPSPDPHPADNAPTGQSPSQPPASSLAA